jgi:general stress protein 26
VAFVTSAGSRKAAEIRRAGRLTLAYQHDRDGAYVALVGRARLDADPASRARVWTAGLDEWFSGGREDPDAVVVRFEAERIELWSQAGGVMPAPRGLRAAVLQREGGAWRAVQA